MNRVPEYGVVRAYLTATAVTFSDEGEDHLEEHGWVNARYSMRELFDSRNDVAPYAEFWPRDSDRSFIGSCVIDDDIVSVADFIRATVADALGSAEDNGDGTWYGSDEIVTDYSDPRSYTYALHFHVKHNDPQRGWVEDELAL